MTRKLNMLALVLVAIGLMVFPLAASANCPFAKWFGASPHPTMLVSATKADARAINAAWAPDVGLASTQNCYSEKNIVAIAAPSGLVTNTPPVNVAKIDGDRTSFLTAMSVPIKAQKSAAMAANDVACNVHIKTFDGAGASPCAQQAAVTVGHNAQRQQVLASLTDFKMPALTALPSRTHTATAAYPS